MASQRPEAREDLAALESKYEGVGIENCYGVEEPVAEEFSEVRAGFAALEKSHHKIEYYDLSASGEGSRDQGTQTIGECEVTQAELEGIEAYLAEKRVRELLNKLCTSVTFHKPNDAQRFLIQELQLWAGCSLRKTKVQKTAKVPRLSEGITVSAQSSDTLSNVV